MASIMDKVSSTDVENAKIDRDSKVNPADCEPGMDDDDFSSGGDSSSWGGSGGAGGGSSWGGDGGSSWGGGGSSWGGDGGSSWGGQQQQQGQEPEKEDADEKFFKALGGFFKGALAFFKELSLSFKTFTSDRKMSFGKRMISLGIGTGVCAVICMALKKSIGLDMLIAGMLTLGFGVMQFMVGYDGVKNGENMPEPEQPPVPQDTGDSWGDYEDAEDSEDSETLEDDEDLYDVDAVVNSSLDDEVAEDVPLDVDEELSHIDIDKGMVTRQYLFETITHVLPSCNKTFSVAKEIPEGGAEFDTWNAVVVQSAEVLRTTQEDMPILIHAEEKLFYILLEVKRVKWLNTPKFVDEIVNIYRFDKSTGKVDESIYGSGINVGNTVYVRIMKGDTAMVSLKDAYSVIKDKILDTDIMMPIVIGVDAEGQVVMQDFKSINSILTAGMPRSGKSWFVQSILAQMMFYMKPSELNFIIMDPKDNISDFKSLHMPHIKKFITKDEEMLNELRHVVNVEGVRRKKLIGDAGYVNIMDYKKEHSDVELPFLYIVIDEVVTLADRMEDTVKKEFQGLLRELVSQLPALGIRIFMIPHIVNDQIISKKTTDLIPCRVSVMGDPKHIENVTGTKNFEHKLTHVGDMAVRLNNDATTYMHNTILTKTNKDNEMFFDFLAKMWAKIEPESCAGSRFEVAKKADEQKELLSGLKNGNASDDFKIWG